MITKEKLYKQIEGLPDKMEMEDLIERLLLIDKLEKRKIESSKDETISEQELDEEIKQWLN